MGDLLYRNSIYAGEGRDNVRTIKCWMLSLILLTVLLQGCGKENPTEQMKTKEAVVIPVIFRVNPENNIGEYQDMVNEFNRLYEGQYYVEVEWMTDTASGYREKIKTLNALDKLPAIITDACFDRNFYELCIANGRFINLEPYIEESEEWKECISQDMLEECREADGGIYVSPLGNPIYSSAGIFYNKELFAKAGITKMPDTWAGFQQCLDILKQQGITPFAMHGAGSYWSPMLVSTAYMATDPKGEEFMKTAFPDSYSNDSMKKLLSMMDKLYYYTYQDALEIDFAAAAQRFYKGEAAMIANGYWMIDEMDEEVRERTGFATFPNDTMMCSGRMSAWAIVSGYSQEVTQGAVAFLKYRSLVSQEDMEKFMQNNEVSLVEKEYRQAIQTVQKIIPNYQLYWEPGLYNDFFTEMMPFYLNGTYDKDSFLETMDQKLIQIQKAKG